MPCRSSISEVAPQVEAQPTSESSVSGWLDDERIAEADRPRGAYDQEATPCLSPRRRGSTGLRAETPS